VGIRATGRLLGGALAVLVAAAVLAPPASAEEEDPLFVPWSQLLPGITAAYDPTAADDCTAGRLKCVDHVIREMARRFEPLAAACNHDAMFSLMYLRTTEEYRRVAATGTFFRDTNFVNHQDVVFANLYFEAFDDWHSTNAARRAETPEAWAIAFDAADRRLVTGTGNMLLGMSAHVNRDLPFALAEIGIIRPDGTSRKDDHDKVNQFLNSVIQPLFLEAAATLDDSVDDGNLPFTTLDETATLQMLVAWREQAWRNAERLVTAATTADRARVAQEIEDFAAIEAQLLVAATSYGPLDWLQGRRAHRDAFCAANQ
jgi:hypothetical protein